MSNLSERLNNLVEASVAVAPMPFDANAPAIDPDTFSGMAGLKPSVSKLGGKKKGCGCGGGCGGCECSRVETIENKAPTKTYRFVGQIKNGADKELAHGYHYTKFMSLLQKMVAPLPIVNKPSGIEVVASPALAKGLTALAKKEGLETTILEGSCSESQCHCAGKNEGSCS